MRSLKIYFLFSFLAFFCLGSLKSQNKIDSLINALANAKNLQQKAIISYNIAFNLKKNDQSSKALFYLDLAKTYLGNNTNDSLLPKIFILKAGTLIYVDNQYDSTSFYLNKAEIFFKLMSNYTKFLFFNTKAKHYLNSEPKLSLKYFLEARKFVTSSPEKLLLIDLNLAQLYYLFGDNVKSNKLLLNSIDKPLIDSSNLSNILLAISRNYCDLKNDSCIFYAQLIPSKHLKLYLSANTNVANYLINVSKNFQEAEKIINKLKNIIINATPEESGQISLVAKANVLSLSARVLGRRTADKEINYATRNLNLASAIKELKYAVEIYKKLPRGTVFYLDQGNDFEYISEFYTELKQTDSALHYYKLSVAMKDSSEKIKNSVQAKDLLAKYDTEKKNAQIVLLNEQNKLSLSENKRQRFIIISSIIMALLFLAGLLIFINRNNLKQRANKILSQQKQQIVNAYAELSKRNNLIEESIEYAAVIQQSILTNESALKKNIPEHLLIHLPKEAVGGDFYWLHKPENSPLLYLAVADCTGHGVPGSLMTLLCNNIFNQVVENDPTINPAQLLTRVNSKLYNSFNSSENPLQRSKDGMDVSLICLNQQTNTLSYAGARNPILLARKEQDVIELKVNRYSIGYLPEFTFEEFKIELQKEDVLYLHTDGYIDQAGANSKTKFLKSNLLKLITSIQSLEIEEQRRELLTAFATWKGDREQTDDVCLVAIKV